MPATALLEAKASTGAAGRSDAVAGVQMNIKFPFEGMDADAACLRTAGVAADALHAADMGAFRYPLIIRLETLADKAAAAEHSLDVRAPGAPLVAWVQSQTTCAVLGDISEGAEEDSCKVLRQRIWVHELFYDLQVRPQL
jgi:hypothetical protein